jgi:hypothetical protein
MASQPTRSWLRPPYRRTSARTLHNLETLGLLANDLGLRVVLRKGVTDPSDARLSRISHIERALVDVMAESAPHADSASYQVVSLRPLCEGVRERLHGTLPPDSIVPERLPDLLRAMAQSFGAGNSKRAILTLRRRVPASCGCACSGRGRRFARSPNGVAPRRKCSCAPS